ncbi:uncharacterized protein JOD43_003766 [Pullulanibacillus pueri]|uniref:Putative phosphohydrolase YueE n=1 Tax=Pullulanibacillus pueri TaxID=1437324 RepID=A0A8J2ZYE3_9BACL|nr:HD domain-containing protein [Pullulanibacillus pueri]MBM7683586.1 uncharacterized protein [Pullulanibacillus pueri]GGH84515.1 putative phosphohydrolase YueE [Pullulanibacillus pueri]
MRKVSLEMVFNHPITQRYLRRSGIAHAVKVAEYAYTFAKEANVDPDLATKAALLHDIGHYKWYRNGEWDFELYKENDIHAIKGANRAHKLLIRIGEDPRNAKQIALAILLHTDSYLPEGQLHLSPLQKVVALADEADEEPSGHHHYKTIDDNSALARIRLLDQRIDRDRDQTAGSA